jgi:NAD kinase
MIVRTIDGSSVVLSHWTLESKDKIKVVGVARQQLHFLCSDKENEAKESLALRWACLARQGGNLNSVKSVRLNVYISPQDPRLLRASPFVEDCRE